MVLLRGDHVASVFEGLITLGGQVHFRIECGGAQLEFTSAEFEGAASGLFSRLTIGLASAGGHAT